MPVVARRPMIALAAVVTAVVMAPLALAPHAAVAEPVDAPGFSKVPTHIPGAAAALAHAKAVVNGRLDDADLTLALRDVAARLTEYSGADRRLAEQLLARPNGGKQRVEDSIGAAWPGNEAPASPLCSATKPICVHWTNTSRHQPPANQVTKTLTEMENVWQKEVDTFNYRAPLTDQRGSIDDDGINFDVYLSDIGDGGYYGYCAVDDSRTFKNYNFYDRSGYCVLDDDFSADQFGNANTPLQNLQVTAAHEFFHAIQFAYDAFEDDWFMEGTAAWIEDEVYDSVNDNLQYLQTSQFVRPEKPLDTASGLSVYGSWGFFRNLTERFNRDVVLKAWQRADASRNGPDNHSMRAVERAIESKGSSLRDAFADYARDNLAPDEYYLEGASYPSPAVGALTLGGSVQSTGWLKKRVDHMAIAYKAAKPNNGAELDATVLIKVDGPNRSTGAQARVLVSYTDGSYGTSSLTLNKRGNGSAVADFGRDDVARVSVALVNASDSYRKCFRYTTQYACGGGVPDHDDRLYSVRFNLR
jgi:hypothetical protein